MHILSALNVLIWGSLTFMGRSLIDGVIQQHVPGCPNVGQISYYLHMPMAMTAIAICIYALFRLRRFTGFLLFAQSILLLAVLPYILFYTGGI